MGTAPIATPCTIPTSIGADVVVVGAGSFVVDALPAATARLAAFGLRLAVPSTIVIDDDVSSFVAATGQTTPTRRAWSTWNTVHLLPPSTWADNTPAAADKRIAHELCHLALWQALGTKAQAEAAHLPRFVVEGVCSVVADQGSSRLPKDQVLALLQTGRRLDFDDDSAFAYGLAHHVFAALLACRGPRELQRIVDVVAAGAAVQEALGSSPSRWLEEGCP